VTRKCKTMKTSRMIISESAVRRKATKRRLRLVKYREINKWYYQYGPYALVDGRNAIRHHSLTLAEASELLDAIPMP
jgi:hypothetical protein